MPHNYDHISVETLPYTSIMEFPMGISSDTSDSKYKAALHFQTITIDPVTVESFGNIVKTGLKDTLTQATGGLFDSAELDSIKTDDNKKRLETIKRVGKDPIPTAADQSRSVVLYLPQAVALNNNVAYENVNLGVIGSATAAAVGQGSSVADALIKGVGAGIGGLRDSLRSENPFGRDYGALIAQRLSGRVSEAAAQGISSVTRVAANPNTRSLFRQVTPREFSFSFTMIPESERESRMIQQIIYFFQTEMMPDEIGIGQVAYGYKFPKMFQIHATYGQNYKQIMTKFLPCTLQDVQVTYNSNAQAFHEGGHFSQVDIVLKFNEYRTRNKADVVHERQEILGRENADIDYETYPNYRGIR
jgi:hypothetical protein|tara:strand:+ start:4710 stop:5789 length:1080 start_codon:yes stop_codon:yes gene_type:complete